MRPGSHIGTWPFLVGLEALTLLLAPENAAALGGDQVWESGATPLTLVAELPLEEYPGRVADAHLPDLEEGDWAVEPEMYASETMTSPGNTEMITAMQHGECLDPSDSSLGDHERSPPDHA